jgi:hypothetical protein
VIFRIFPHDTTPSERKSSNENKAEIRYKCFPAMDCSGAPRRAAVLVDDGSQHAIACHRAMFFIDKIAHREGVCSRVASSDALMP